MVKALLFPLLTLLATPFSLFSAERPDYKSFLNTETNERGKETVVGVANYISKGQVRVYSFNNTVDEIAPNAFTGTGVTEIVLSKDITYVTNESLNDISNIYYTGSLEEFQALNLSFDTSHVTPYSVDEGFINYWNTYIRPNAEINICNDVSKETFGYVYGLYKDLIQSDLVEVDKYVDIAGAKIGDSMKELIRLYASDQGSQKKKDEWNQTGAITLIIVISIVGMTSIAIFFLLKTKKIID